MSAETRIPRLRMFAGPNGSGKSTLYRRLQTQVDRPDIFGVYLNADDIESSIRTDGSIKLADYGVEEPANDLLSFFTIPPFCARKVSRTTPDASRYPRDRRFILTA